MTLLCVSLLHGLWGLSNANGMSVCLNIILTSFVLSLLSPLWQNARGSVVGTVCSGAWLWRWGVSVHSWALQLFFFWLPENISGLARNHCTTNMSLLPVNCKHGDVTWFVSWASKLKMSLFRGSSHSVSTEWQCLESEGLLVFFLFFSKRYWRSRNTKFLVVGFIF